MQSYLFIESRDPFESNDVAFLCDLASGLAKAGHGVTVYLVQNGVLPARRGARAEDLRALSRSGVRVLADDFSLSERGIDPSRLAAGIEPASIDVVVEHLSAGHKILWH
jgi:hypothetical protein